MTNAILVVDDAATVRMYHRAILEQGNFCVAEAANGYEALEVTLERRFALMLVDVNMPRMDGFSFLRTLRRAAPEVATLPALMITTEAAEQGVGEARAGGANFYLVKSVSEADLLRHAAILTGAPP